ncbi:beta-eliminating lyase-related protein [Nocardioides sp. QY071]|uniref:threonine aldolase family protein n=1 Tax=Nocardioides sp. QY071 TaxID=3044187 RepID=UPI002499EC58|nr:aminotransferase class I/II-fold pyridoxal phosphate-dependent enzyme [Nocardioides sp. QY071]WGY01791.1 beta-eliminating lyase-related protein [Nocardioides sp. QY071]
MSRRIALASDNWSPTHPDLLAALAAANDGPAPAYGSDRWSAGAAKAFRAEFGRGVRVYPTFGGTGANTVALAASLTGAHEAVVCADDSHVLTDEAGALARFAGASLVPVATDDGMLDVGSLEAALRPFVRGEHQVRPAVVTLANATETGRVYDADQVRELADWAHARDLLVHLDGARLANAAVHEGASLRDLSIGAGVDLLTLGGAKNGMMFGEAVVVASRARVPDLRVRHVRKQAGQLASKQRFIGAQFHHYLQAGLWQANAERANEAARRLAEGLAELPGARLAFPVEANLVFVDLSVRIRAALADIADFHVYDEDSGRCRLVCSYDTDPADIAEFLAVATAAATTRRRRPAATRPTPRGANV